jgi:hypothetical protein
MSEKIIRLMLSCGQVEEGVLENWCEVDETDGSLWVVISIKGNPKKKLKINRLYIAAHQIEESVDVNKIPLQVEQFSEREVQPRKKLPFNTHPIPRTKEVAEQKIADEHCKKREISREYVENVYADPSSMLKRDVR